MRKFNKIEFIRILILIAVLVLVVLIFDIPLYKNISEIYQNLKMKKENFATQLNLGNSVEKSLEDYNKYHEQIPAFEELISKSGDELTLITNLEKLAQSHNLNQSLNLSSSKNQLTEQIETLQIGIDLIGNYQGMVNYIADLEKMNFKVLIKAINISTTLDNQLTAKLLVNSYWFKD